MINRRIFLKAGGLALVAGTFLPDVFVRAAEAATRRRRTLVVIFQRGAVDGLNLIVPHAEPAYYRARPTIAVPRPGGTGGALDLDGRFGLHPAMAPLMPFYRDHSLALVHAAGSPDTTRSHFDAQDFMESGTPGVKSTRQGFLARALAEEPAASPLRAVALTPALPRIFAGSPDALAMNDISRFGLRAAGATRPVADSFESMYGAAVDVSMRGTAEDSFDAVRVLEASDPTRIRPANGARYPRGDFGDALRQIAQLIRADVGLEVAFADVEGWDTHVAEGASEGQLARLLGNYTQAIAAFITDLGSRMGDVVLVTMSEFGRTVKENGNRGTDHGHGNVMAVLGGGVRGGKVYGQWPGLDERHLYEGRDLEVTTDFRDVMGEILVRHSGVGKLGPVFPGYRNDAETWLGLMG